jgi:SAM-dependent methyltransferase
MTLPFSKIAAFYDLLYKDKDYAGEARFVLTELERYGLGEGHMLNLGCGTGRHDVCFAEAGRHVLGVDLSSEMISQALKMRDGATSKRLSFEVGDARSYRTTGSFASVVSLFHVASYQVTDEDVEGFLETAAAHLAKGGLLFFDFWHSAGVLSDPPVVRVKRLSGQNSHYIRIAEPDLKPGSNRVTVNYTVFCGFDDGRTTGPFECFTEAHHMRHFSLSELNVLLGRHGFEVLHAAPWLKSEDALDTQWYAYLIARKIT